MQTIIGVLKQTIIAWLKQTWLVQLIGVVALCAVIWFAGPLVAFANRVPFEPELHRFLAILVVIMCWLGYKALVPYDVRPSRAILLDDTTV